MAIRLVARPVFLLQSAALPYRWREGGLEVCLITSARRRRWILPKGNREACMTPAECAAMEAWEEAGVRGAVWDIPIGHWHRRKHGVPARVEVFPLEVADEAADWPERHCRRRRWLPAERAAALVREDGPRRLLVEFPEFLACYTGETAAG